MHSNIVLRVADTRCLSPQTISSSGYHSDLSSTNESPKSIHDNVPGQVGLYPSMRIRKKAPETKLTSLSHISSFLRKQYARAKSKFTAEKPHGRPLETCTKATSTTAIPYLSNDLHHRQSLSAKYQQSAFIEPVHSVYVHPLQDNTLKKFPPRNYTSIHDCYSQRPMHHLASRPKFSKNGFDSSAFHPPTRPSNAEKLTAGCYPSTNQDSRRLVYSQNYYPYKYLNKTYDQHRQLYVPLSDFISTTANSAFKPIRIARRHPLNHPCDQMLPSNDPCDLEVAHYLCRTPQRSNPNYFNTYQLDVPRRVARKTHIETLC